MGVRDVAGYGGVSGVGRAVLEIEGDPLGVWCCGAVSVRSGGSLKFCTMPAGTCTVQAHQAGRVKGAKHTWEGFAFYIQTSDKTALVTPFLKKSLLSSTEKIEVRGRVFSVEQWIQLFGILEDQTLTRLKLESQAFTLESGAGQVPANLVNVTSVADRVARAVDFQTPRKTAAIEPTVTIKSELTSLEELPAFDEKEVDSDVWSKLLGGNWNKLVGVVGTLEATVPVIHNQCIELFQGLSGMLEGVEDKANALGLVLGHRGPQMDAEGTVWDAIARSIALATNVEDVIGSVSSDLVTVDKTVRQIDDAFKSHVGAVLKVVSEIHGSHKRMQERIVKLESTVRADAVNATEIGLSAAFRETIPMAVAEELADLRVEFAELWDEIQETAAHLVSPSGGGQLVTTNEFHERLQKVEMRATGESYISDQRVYASYEDVLNWVQGSAGRAEIHLYWDIFSLLSKTRDDTFTTHEYLEGALMSERLKLNPLTSLVMSSLQIQMPGPFLPKRSGTVSGSSAAVPLPTVKTFDDWNMVQTGFNHQLQRSVTTEVGGLRRMMSSTISRQDFELSGLAIHLLTQAQIQWASMATWITDFYHRLVGEGGLTSKESWLIVGMSVQAIFSLIHRTTRAAGHDAIISSGDKAVKAAHFLWATMQTHRLFTEIQLVNWDAHHCVQAVLSMHVVRNRITPTAFDTLAGKIDTLTRLMDKLDGRISTLEKKKGN